MDDAGLTSKLETPAPVATRGLETITSTFGDSLDRSTAVLNASLRFWQTETVRFIDEASVQGQATFARLCNSKTPLDVINAEHEWLRARSRSVMDSGVRLLDALATAAWSAQAQAQAPAKARKGSV